MTWHYLPKEASPCVRAAADLTWVLSLPALVLPPPHLSSGKNTHDRGLSQHKSKGGSRLLQSGVTLSHSAASRGEALLIPSSPDTPASHSAKPGSASEKTIRATFGQTLPALSERSGRDGLSLKMLQGTLPSAQKPFCGSYTEWVSMLRLASLQRQKLARRTKGKGGSAWPAATATHSNSQVEGEFPNQTGGTTLAGAAEKLCPTAKAMTGGANCNRKARGSGGADLQEAVENWGTPNAHRMNYDENPDAYQFRQQRMKAKSDNPPMGVNLGQQAQNWATPATRDYKGARGEGMRSRHYRSISQLPDMAELEFSHPDQQTMAHGPMSSQHRQIARRLLRSAMLSVSPTTKRRWLREGNWRKRRLNVLFVEWLMGWPTGHTASNCSEMEWCLWRRGMRSELYSMPTAVGQWMWQPPIEEDKPKQLELI